MAKHILRRFNKIQSEFQMIADPLYWQRTSFFEKVMGKLENSTQPLTKAKKNKPKAGNQKANKSGKSEL